MAGHRRKAGKPLRRTVRYDRRRARLHTELADATTDADRVAAAADFLRAALAANPNPGIASEVVDDLIDAGERVYKSAGGVK